MRWLSEWRLHNTFDDMSTLVQAMAWCCQVTNYYLNQSSPRFMSPYCVTWPQSVKHNSIMPVRVVIAKEVLYHINWDTDPNVHWWTNKTHARIIWTFATIIVAINTHSRGCPLQKNSNLMLGVNSLSIVMLLLPSISFLSFVKQFHRPLTGSSFFWWPIVNFRKSTVSRFNHQNLRAGSHMLYVGLYAWIAALNCI